VKIETDDKEGDTSEAESEKKAEEVFEIKKYTQKC